MITKTFCLKDITKGDFPCANPTVRWSVPSSDCLLSSCKDCKDECITVTVLDDCDINCVKAIVECPDCDGCPAEIFDVCFCNKDEDCDVCSKCSPEGLCVKKCPEYCDDGTCGECSEDKHCPGDKICVNGDCVCPEGKIEDGDRCLDCDENSPPKNCQVCVDGHWKPKDCGDGVCDPDTGECVGCFNAGDCGENECCEDNKCVCCDGFVYDVALQKCVPQPPCTTDDDCPDCSVCDGTDCVPRQCPEGYICYNDKCVPLCNCDEPTCTGKNGSCTEIYDEVCACIPCEGNCDDNSDCGPGCYCDNGVCKASPCGDTPCDDGLDCADGCGCDGNRCVPCSSLDCSNSECEITLGCECQGSGCVDSDNKCSGNCTTPGDCGEGCGCYKGKCVSCDNFDCDDCDKAEGCGCTDGVCVDDEGECTDTFEINKNDDNCEIEARLITANKCSCDRITISAEVKESTSQGINFLVDLRKGDATVESILSLPKLGDTGIANDLPLSGAVNVRVVEYGMSVSVPNGNVVFSDSYSVSGIDSFETGFLNFNQPGSTITNPQTGAVETVSRVEVIFEVDKKSLNFENSCSYSEEKTTISYKMTANGGNGFDKYANIASGVGTYRKYKVLLSDTYRTPIFTWYGQSEGSSREVVRRGYATRKSEGVYVDGWLDHTDGIVIGKYYSVESDCACDKTAYYKCPETGAISTLRYCNPENLVNRLVYTLSDCNKTITLKGSSNIFNICPSNSLGSQIFQVELNDNVVDEFTASNGKLIIEGTYTLEQPVKEIGVVLKGNNCPDCYEPITLEDAVIEIDELGYDCENQQLTYSLSGGSGNYAVFVDGSPVQVIGGISLKKGEYEITFKDNVTGCEESGSVKVDCCGELYISPYNVLYCDGIDPTVRFDIVNGQPTYKYFIEKDGVVIGSNVTNEIGNAYEFTNPEEGTYTLRVVDDIGCEATAEFDMETSQTPAIGFGDLTYCQGVTTKTVAFELSGGSSYDYSIKNAGNTVASGTVAGNFTKELSIAASKTYTIEVQTELGCVVEDTFTLISKSCPDPEVVVVTQPVCEDTPLIVTATITGGTPPYTWSLEESGTEIASGNGNVVGHDTGTTYSTNAGSVTFKVTATDANGKTSSDTGTIQVIDNSDPNCIVCEDAPDVNIVAFTGGNNVDVGETVTLTSSNINMISYAWLEGSTTLGTNLLFSPSTNNEGVHIYRLRYEYSAGCFAYTPEFKLTISDGFCNCDAAIAVTGGIPGLSGKVVTSVNKGNGQDVCVGDGSINLQANLGVDCDEGDPNNPLVVEWTLLRYQGGNNVETIQTNGMFFNYTPTAPGELSISMAVQDGTCYASAVTLPVTIKECTSAEEFDITVFDSDDVCQSDANSVKVNFNVYAGALGSGYDTFPFTWKIVKVGGSSHTFKSGIVNGGWSQVGTHEFVEYIDLTPFINQSNVTFKVEVKRTDTGVIKSGQDTVAIISDSSIYCDECAFYDLSVTINEASGGVVQITEGDTATLTAKAESGGLSGSSTVTYKWKKGSTVVGTNKVLSVTPTQDTTYSVTIENQYGCTASRSVTVKVNPLCRDVNQTLSWDVSSACPGDPIVLTWNVGSHVGSPEVIINGTALPFAGSSGTHNMNMPTSDAVAKLRSYHQSGCPVTENTATVNKSGLSTCCTLNNVVIQGTGSTCPGATNTYTVNPNGNDSGYTYAWFDAASGGSQIGTGLSTTYTKSNSSSDTIRVEASKSGCPTVTGTKTITNQCSLQSSSITDGHSYNSQTDTITLSTFTIGVSTACGIASIASLIASYPGTTGSPSFDLTGVASFSGGTISASFPANSTVPAHRTNGSDTVEYMTLVVNLTSGGQCSFSGQALGRLCFETGGLDCQ